MTEGSCMDQQYCCVELILPLKAEKEKENTICIFTIPITILIRS